MAKSAHVWRVDTTVMCQAYLVSDDVEVVEVLLSQTVASYAQRDKRRRHDNHVQRDRRRQHGTNIPALISISVSGEFTFR